MLSGVWDISYLDLKLGLLDSRLLDGELAGSSLGLADGEVVGRQRFLNRDEL